MAPPVNQPAVKSYEGYQDVTRMAQQVQFEDLLESPILACGDVDYCTRKVVDMVREFGFNEMLCWTRIGGLDQRKVLRAMNLIAGKVIPGVKKALGS